MKKFNLLISIGVVIACLGCAQNSSKTKEAEKAKSDSVTIADKKEKEYKEQGTRMMGYFGADLGWKSKGKTTIDFAEILSERTVAFKGVVKDIYYENGHPFAVIYDMGTATNSFICYAELYYDQLNILKRTPRARGYFAIKIKGVLQGKPEFSSEDDDFLSSRLIVKSQGDMVSFFLKQ